MQPVDFTALKPRAEEFLREAFSHIFINTQRSTPITNMNSSKVTFTRSRTAIEEIFIKATRVQALAMGLVYFLTTMAKDRSGVDGEFAKFIPWAAGVAIDTLRNAVDSVPLP